jgi:hypothetical protein
VRNGIVLEQAQHLRESVHHAQAGDVAASRRLSFEIAGMSTYSTEACVTFLGSNSLASSSRRASGTLATPTRAAVEPMRVSWCAPVRIVNNDVLPTMGRPIMAVFIWDGWRPAAGVDARYRGTSVRLSISSMMRSPRSERRCASAVRVLTITRCAEHRRRQALHVVRNGVLAPLQQRQRLHRAEQRLRAARAYSQGQRFVRARLFHDGQHVIDQRLLHRHALHRSLQPYDVVARKHRTHAVGGGHLQIAQDLALAGRVRIADAQAHQEAVHLRLRQRIGAVVLHRILRGDHHEGARQHVRTAVDGHLAFVHGFQQRRLRLGRGAIDLVGQQEIGEDRPGLNSNASECAL